MKMNYKIDEDTMYVEGDYSKEKRREKVEAHLVAYFGFAILAGFLIWAAVSGHTLQ